MKQSISLLKKMSLFALSFTLLFASCSKNSDSNPTPNTPAPSYAGNFLVADENETYVLKIENKGGNHFQIKEFGGFLNVPLNAYAEGSSLNIPSQTFKNPNGHTLTIVGKGTLSTKTAKDDTIKFEYSVSGFTEYESEFVGTRN